MGFTQLDMTSSYCCFCPADRPKPKYIQFIIKKRKKKKKKQQILTVEKL